MTRRDLAAASSAVCLAFVLSACGRSPEGQVAPSRGRYVGIGVYSAGSLWPKMVVGQPVAATMATTADDEHIIVTVDSSSGEVRECGDYSGVCVSLNPWTRAIAAPQTAPVKLSEHLADLAAQTRSEGGRSR